MKKFLLFMLFLVAGISVPALADTTYEKVTDAKTLADGDEVIIVGVYEGSYYAMSPNSASSKITATAVTVTNNSVTLKDGQTDVQVLTLAESTTTAKNFALKQKDGTNYVLKGSRNTDTKYGTPAYYSTISLANDGAATINIASGRKLRHYQGKDFRGYADNSGTAIYIYRKATTAPTLTLGKIEVKYGDQVIAENSTVTMPINSTVTVSSENAGQILYQLYDADRALLTNDPVDITSSKSISFTEAGEYMVTVMSYLKAGDLEGESTWFYVNVTDEETPETPEVPAGRRFVKVTKPFQFVVGKNYIIAGVYKPSIKTNPSVFAIMGATPATNNIPGISTGFATDVTEIRFDGETEDTKIENYLVMVLGGDKEKGFYLSDGGTDPETIKYLNPTSNTGKNYLHFDHPKTVGLELFAYPFDDNGSFGQIIFTSKTSRNILYLNRNETSSTPSPIFSAYDTKDTEDYSNVVLFVEEQVAMPSFDEEVLDADKVSVTSTMGELHVWTIERDYKTQKIVKENTHHENPLKDANDNPNSASIIAKAPAANWTNKVEEQGDKHDIYINEIGENNYLQIIAKSVQNNIHSDELMQFIRNGEVVAAIEGIEAADKNAPVEYYNLQGVRVAGDQPGLYIRRQGNQVTKIYIK